MSYSEILCEKSLRLVFENGVEIVRNYRPTFLKSSITGKNLEMDFYIPHMNLAIEIQGEHHYTDIEQRERDIMKRKMLKSENITLIELSIFQVTPTILRKKILDYSHYTQYQARINNYDPKWNTLQYVKDYKNKISSLYPNSTCVFSPHINRAKDESRKLYGDIDITILSNVEFNYVMGGNLIRITPLKIVSKKSVECRILGTDKIITVKKKSLIKT